jgi:murein DD-endopeptidase MepM/ murein hydrolase activator NlpD
MLAFRFAILIVLAAVALGFATAAVAAGDPGTAALQVALRREGFYAGPVDGIAGIATASAVRALQSANGIAADGVAGPQTDQLLGSFGRRELGTRVLGLGDLGWDVAELQFALAWHGFPSGPFDGSFGSHLEGALRRFQRFARVPVDGRAGAATLAALRAPLPRPTISLARPLTGPVGDGFGPRGDRFHAGVDLPAATGDPVAAAATGRVTWVGYRDGWGLVVTLAHSGGVRTLYAHLSSAAVLLGQRVAAGAVVGRVGATGDATGPHLHFEVRVGGAAVDPLSALS